MGICGQYKKSQKSKCDGDIKKIIDTNRGYTKIFIITNQAIKNDKRLEYQDNKSQETRLTITIFDKTWILDKALDTKNLDLLEKINITQPLKEKQMGSNNFEEIILQVELMYIMRSSLKK